MLVNRLSKSCGDNVAVFENVYMYHVDRIEFGSHVSIHPMCYVMGFGGISIGSNVSIAHGTSIITTNHDFEQSAMAIRDAPVEAAPVTIGDDVWIGAGVRILAGVTIGNHVVVGANAVVTSDVSSNTLVAGVPARPIKHLNR
ncbi:MAG: acyltransferase [Anaerolineae bacterium]|nr:acyltransferase [Anaerolineae bacterium]